MYIIYSVYIYSVNIYICVFWNQPPVMIIQFGWRSRYVSVVSVETLMFFIHARRPWGSNNQKTCQKTVMPPVLYGISPLIYIYIYVDICVWLYIYGLSMAYLWDYRPLNTKWVAPRSAFISAAWLRSFSERAVTWCSMFYRRNGIYTML